MFLKPGSDVFEFDPTFCDTHGEVFEFSLFGFHFVAECRHQVDGGGHCGSFVPVYEGMAANDGFHEGRSFLERRGKVLLAERSLPRAFQRRKKTLFVAYAFRASVSLYRNCVEEKDFREAGLVIQSQRSPN